MAIIGYVTLGTCDLAKAGAFYDPIATELGTGRMWTTPTIIAYGTAGGPPGVCVMLPHDGAPASVGNGVMVALEASDPAQVDRIYAAAMDHGGTDAGAPGPRGDGGFYAAYFRDPDGNTLNAFVMGAA